MSKSLKKSWRPFQFSDIFEIRKGFYNKKPAENFWGSIPFLGATDSNNGVTQFTSLNIVKESTKTGVGTNAPLAKKLFPGSGIAVTNNGSVGHAYYQPAIFTCSHDVNPLYLLDHNITEGEAMFIITAIEQQGKLFQYARKWRPKRMVKSKIMLPIKDGDTPDYSYMKKVGDRNISRLLKSQEKYILQRICKLGCIVPLKNRVKWKSFRLPELFNMERGRESNMSKLTSGNVPLVSAKKYNNGVKAFVDTSRKVFEADNVITLNNDGEGGAGLAYYQPANFALDTHVTALRAKQNTSRYALLFIASCLSVQHKIFGHGRSISLPRANRLSIMLPVDDNDNPNYSYMEQYVKNKMIEKYKKYIDYIS